VLPLFLTREPTDTAPSIGDMTESLLTGEQVASVLSVLSVPRSSVYEQSRAEQIPTSSASQRPASTE
jgi:hypothetical protein